MLMSDIPMVLPLTGWNGTYTGLTQAQIELKSAGLMVHQEKPLSLKTQMNQGQ